MEGEEAENVNENTEEVSTTITCLEINKELLDACNAIDKENNEEEKEDENNEEEKENSKSAKKIGKYQCKLCPKTCSTNFNLRRHYTRCHEGNKECMKETTAGRKTVCLECGERFVQVVFLRKHLVENHGFQYDEYEIHFDNMDDFGIWKKGMEERTNSGYAKKAKRHVLADGSFVDYYHCNRSGNYRPKVDEHSRKRKLKASGTIKSNNACTSWIRVFQDKPGKVTAKFVSTHYGHDEYVKILPSKSKRTKTTGEKTKSKKNSGKKHKNKKNETSTSSEAEIDISTLKHELMSELWNISCRVEKCTSIEALLILKDEILKTKELI